MSLHQPWTCLFAFGISTLKRSLSPQRYHKIFKMHSFDEVVGTNVGSSFLSIKLRLIWQDRRDAQLMARTMSYCVPTFSANTKGEPPMPLAEWWSECRVRSIFALTDKQLRRSRDTSLEHYENTHRDAKSAPITSTDCFACHVYSEKLLNTTRCNDTFFRRVTNIIK